MSSSVPVPAAEMTQSPEHLPDEPAAQTADTPARRAPRLARRARAAARPISSTGALITVIALLAGAVGSFVLRELNSIEADIVRLETEMDARFVRLDTEMDARFVKLETEIDARFVKLETEMDARFDELEEGQQEIALTLGALVAYLRADEGVDAALPGRLLDPAADPAEPLQPMLSPP